MSISADRLRALRKQAGDTTVREMPASAQREDAVAMPVDDQGPRGSHGVATQIAADVPALAASNGSPPRKGGPSDVAVALAEGTGLPPARERRNQIEPIAARESALASGPQRRALPTPESKRTRERSVLDWMDPPSTPAANESHRRGLQPQNVDALRRLIAARERKPVIAGGSPVSRRSSAADRALPGEVISPGLHLIEAFLPQAIPSTTLSLAFAKRHEEAVDPRQLLFFDTETTGLAGGTGTRAFMIGAADWHVCAQRGQGLRVRQLMMSTMAAEGAMLRTFNTWLSGDTVLSSYNGRSYDAPLLKTRYRLARMLEPLTALDHVDLLHPTRRRYRGTWENCKLATVERQLLRIVREDDLPGSEAPAAWLTFLRGGSARNLCRVAHHNHQDVVTLALLFQRLVQAEEDDREVLAFEEAP